MTDIFSPEKRSAIMSRIGGKNTAPEMRVRKAAHAMGLRFRLHKKSLPGTPDLVFKSRRTALYVHGCFWHRHGGCRLATHPKSNVEFWAAKFDRNVSRDGRVKQEMGALGWRVVVIWECETRTAAKLASIICERVIQGGIETSESIRHGQPSI
ncbi:very short patch repair endonuclease [Rhizobium leguminosarum]|uniref:very short patch repair endonuclease n=1 Tax=Rhizobium leguminosarum TaxID=384 RepID=UPI0013B8C080|nr:DNA mismatch endonuclease Vsr [Rhizobium leguminosarum]MBY5325401.1 DNA mismatch endonuclease Vsr [Rhizobium leguminosarum]MBY5381465.1 DNA mismatch endonuclease Vsr [Rhizobium leguminosarum]MCA2432836.1 DNA mismatch endonuclease Vsr [Rhizobium leguminosarum]NEH68644.1 DNA mismatch endonuclease Vsr [Rhizobium leguminosarum]